MQEALKALQSGQVIPACPLALNAARKLDERRQRALVRYYAAAGAGGLAIGVHTTQFAIRDPKVGLFAPLLELVAEESKHSNIKVRIGGICGATPQAITEADLLRKLGYHAGLLNLGALKNATEDGLIEHCHRIAQIIPIIGFYLQSAAGGRSLTHNFWRRFAEIENVVAIKIAPFNRYQTIDVVRAVAESGRFDIALYTGNDDNIVINLVTPFRFEVNGRPVERRIVGGLLGHWAVWTYKAVRLFDECQRAVKQEQMPPDTRSPRFDERPAAAVTEVLKLLSPEELRVAQTPIDFPEDSFDNQHGSTDGANKLVATLLRRNIEVTDANAALFDAANGFAGCIAGLHEVLRRQGLLEGIWCLDPNETLSRGQAEEINRVYRAYPHLNDDAFVREHLDRWLR